ncbi:hypothetical protein JOC94_000318 [Bacillus thermophilus]|uniref:Uncharacterized protein n=1 Tax=Siminovitchia thermophila TaxID=1245522 RepID=A0ABS2R151_9BACI|nr:hypothetical protein [Siminovitchia thermophila]
MLVERIGHLGAVFTHLDLLYSFKILKWESYGFACVPYSSVYCRKKP